MKVILAGQNLDQSIVARFRAYLEQRAAAPPPPSSEHRSLRGLDPQSLSPETLSAAYARISRDPHPIPDLRAQAIADVTAARKSNQRIIFGFGHASVAEHAVFNLDILDISRIAMEALESSRLASYTEKSQRYITLDRDYVVPEEVAAAGLERQFRELVRKQQDHYQTAHERLLALYQQKHPDQWEKRSGRRALEGAAKEDARYFLSLATTAQVGVTMNARTLEATVRRLAADPLQECRHLAEAIHAAVIEAAPSLVRYVEASEYRRETPPAIEHWVCSRWPDNAPAEKESDSESRPAARLVFSTPNGDDMLLTALVAGSCGRSWADAEGWVASLDQDGRRELVLESLRRLDEHATILRQFEIPEFTFELIASASCFAQLKRHRLATLLPQPYEPALGVTIPPAFREAGLLGEYRDVCAHAESLAEQIRSRHRDAAAYILTNGHRRRVIFKANARELYHLARLRLDAHAQWDIRHLSEEMIGLARKALPLTMLMACGRDQFSEHRRRVLSS